MARLLKTQRLVTKLDALRGFQTAAMNEDFDVVIVGGGLVGSAIAAALGKSIICYLSQLKALKSELNVYLFCFGFCSSFQLKAHAASIVCSSERWTT